MDELFRFSVIRATNKSSPVVARVTSPAVSREGGTAVGLQPSLVSTAQSLAGNASNEDLWARLTPLATQWLGTNGPQIVADALFAQLTDFIAALEALTDPANAAVKADEASIQKVFTDEATFTAAALAAYRAQLGDLFVALLVVRRGGASALNTMASTPQLQAIMPLLAGTPALTDVAANLGACDLAAAGASALAPDANLSAADAKAALAAAISARTGATVLFPPGLASVLQKPALGVGFREFQIVKQHIRNYQAAEIGRIDNILKGESRQHVTRHSLSTETDTTTSDSTTTTTDTELDTDDHTQIQTQANAQVQTDTKLDAGVHAAYSGPSYKIQADLTVSYNKSTANTQQYSTDTAKDVTKKASTQVTEVVSRTQTTKVIEKYFERQTQAFDNTKGNFNINGIYQWVEKTYLCQMFNIGRHMLIDLTVPEPGANLLAMATVSSLVTPPPVEPQPLGTIQYQADGKTPLLDRYGRMQLAQALNPLQLSTLPADPNYYGNWVALYNASSVTPPPDQTRSFSQPVSFPYKDDNDPSGTGQVQIDDGYAASTVNVNVSALSNDNPSGGIDGTNVYVNVSVGGKSVHLPWQGSGRTNTLVGALTLDTPVSGTVTFDIYGHNIDQMDVNVEFVATALPRLFDQWRLQTYDKIVTAYQTLEQNYDTASAVARMATQTVGPLGSADPDANALAARIELKRSCIAIMDNSNDTVSGKYTPVALDPPAPVPPANAYVPDPSNPQLPEPFLATAQAFGARVRWFEEAFEWENMAYVLFPYYWGRRSQWVTNMALTNEDPEFLQFLQAGYGRVVVPVRIGFEAAVQFYLNTGLPWLGGDLPPVGDDTQNPLYLDVAEEIKALTGGGEPNETETPVGDPWDYVLPTTLMLLRDTDDLPQWSREIPAGDTGPAYASDPPIDSWTWQEGAPASS